MAPMLGSSLLALAIFAGALPALVESRRVRDKVVKVHSGAADKPEEGYVWHVDILPDDYCSSKPADPSRARNCAADGALKARRGKPMVTHAELLAMASAESPSPVLRGPINGWGAIAGVKLMSITCKRDVYLWRHGQASKNGETSFVEVLENVLFDTSFDPDCPRPLKTLRMRVALPPWSSVGWSQSSPGFVWWYKAQDTNPRVMFGEDLLSVANEGRAVRAHLFTHRYAVANERWKDKLTWHTAVLLEWDHAKYTTVVELAWLNGIGGYGAKSNWYDDKDDKSGTALWRALPQSMIAPWNTKLSELRVNDVQAKNLEEFGAYLKKYSPEADEPLPANKQRFFDPELPMNGKSADVKLYRNTAGDIARYLVNYIRADGSYSELTRNCQTFAADLFTFLTGAKGGMKLRSFEHLYHRHVEWFVQEPFAL